MLGQTAHRVRGFLDLLRTAWIEYERDHARYLAGAMVYYALVSLIPLLLLLLSVLGLLLRFSEYAAATQQQVLGRVEAAFGAPLRATVEQLLTSLQQESIAATVVGLLGLLLTASVLFHHLRLSFRAIWKYAPPLVSGPVWVAVRASFVEKAIAYVLVLMCGGLLLVAVALIGLARWLHALLESLPVIGPSGGWLITTLSPFTLAATSFAFLFRFMPPVPIRWRDTWVAAVLCAVGWTISSALLSLFGAYLGKT
ncbi:MAG: YhjD/YihY/BrkB family envelope integrity protein [bacterium]